MLRSHLIPSDRHPARQGRGSLGRDLGELENLQSRLKGRVGICFQC